MPRFGINFRQALGEGAGTIQDRVDPHVLAPLEAVIAEGCQVSRGVLQKSPGWLRLTGLSPTGYAIQFDGTAAEGVSFPDHADYDLGKRWTVGVTWKPTNLSAQHPIVWRADDSNNKIVALEQKTDGTILLTHRDAAGTEVTLTSAATVAAGETVHIRVLRFFEHLRLILDRQVSATRADLATDQNTAPADNKWYVGVGTVTDGDTVTGVASAVGVIDEFRVWREELLDDDPYAFSEYPWLGDERLVLYARFNETTGSPADISSNGNSGTVLGSPTQGATALVVPLATILKLMHMRLTTALEKWLVWSNGSMYAVGVT